jgi:hypothetical protein
MERRFPRDPRLAADTDVLQFQANHAEKAGAGSERRFTRSDGHLHAPGADLHAREVVCTLLRLIWRGREQVARSHRRFRAR